MPITWDRGGCHRCISERQAWTQESSQGMTHSSKYVSMCLINASVEDARHSSSVSLPDGRGKPQLGVCARLVDLHVEFRIKSLFFSECVNVELS
jgi:hypothetical protein